MPNGWQEVRQWWSTPSSDPTSDALRSLTAPDDLIMVVGCQYDPQTPFFLPAGRVLAATSYPGLSRIVTSDG